MRSCLTLAGAALALAACGDIGAPLRTDHYEWRVTSSTDTTAFTWPRDSLPVRVWVKDTLNFPQHAADAIAAWEATFLYREWRAELTDDSASAHVIVMNGYPPAGGVLLARITECEALTAFDLDFANKALQLPIEIYLQNRFEPNREDTQRCFGIAMKHEIGHAMGILRHSPDPNDIMYFNPTAEVLTPRDRSTAEVMYHAPSNVVIIPGD